MLKQLDKLILRAFFGPFFITFSVLVFIFLTQFLLKYFEELIGKNLGIEVYAELIFYFSLNMVPQALPLSVLLASLMTYGTLGEHRELTAIKSAGISLTRIIKPVMVLSILLVIGNWFFYDRVVPKANLQAFSLLYDIRTKKLALDIKPGVFYYGLPNYAVRLGSKAKDGRTVKDIMIYDHTQGGNQGVILADSGQMYTMLEDRYLVLELYRGTSANEVVQNRAPGQEFVRNNFGHSKLIFPLNSFDLSRTDVGLFSSNRLMRNTKQLLSDSDSLHREAQITAGAFVVNYPSYYPFMFRQVPYELARIAKLDSIAQRQLQATPEKKRDITTLALNQARNIKTFSTGYSERVKGLEREVRVYNIELWRKITQSMAVFVLFLIGAPLGAIIKKGGLGMPIICSIIFFILFYILSITGEKWAKEGVVAIQPGMWAANFVLLWFGLYFLYLAQTDSNLFETDFYSNLFRRFRKTPPPKLETQ